MSNFNWQTEDDVEWDDLEPVEETAVPRRHPWITYALIVVGVITAVTLIYRQVNQRIETATANATGDILASHNLVQQASADHDVELFNTLLSGVDDAWVEAQSELVEQNGLFDRSTFDLTRLSVDTAVTQTDIDNGTVTVEMNPELNAAELTFPQEYVVNVGNGVTETVQLEQTAVYRLGTQRWLFAPPTDEFWGEFASTSGAMLRLAYPARDAELAQRLAFDLEAKLAEMCRSLADLNCPDNFRLNVRLHSDPQLLVDLTHSDFVLDNGGQLNLPTPTLVGLPVDEAGYQVLFRGYAIQLVSTAVAQLTGYECCRHVAYFQALLDYQLAELRLRPLNLDRVDYERVIQEDIAFAELGGNWNSSADLSAEDGWEVVTAVDFLRHQLPDAPVALMQRQMEGRRQTLNTWLMQIAAEPGVNAENAPTASSLEETWPIYAWEQYEARLEPPPLPLPTQNIYLLCTSGEGEGPSTLYQYRLADSEWLQHPFDVPILSLSPLPDDRALLLMNITDQSLLRTSLWQDGSEQFLFDNGTISFGQFDPTGQYLLVYEIEGLDINQVDWAACTTGDCPLELLGGNPVWSPQGTDFIMLPTDSLGMEPFVVNGRTILFDDPASRQEKLFRGNGQPPTANLDELTYLGLGYAPFWLDETTFGYVRQIPSSSEYELVLMSTADEQPRPILTETDLQQALPDTFLDETQPLLFYAVPYLQQPGMLFVVASVGGRDVAVFSYHLQTNDVQFLLKTGIDGIHSLGFSPDGRFLVVTGGPDEQQSFENRRNDIYLFDLKTNHLQTFAGTSPIFAPSNTYDWSADGQWLAFTQENQLLTLAAPAYGYQQFIPLEVSGCANVAWLNR